MPTSWEELFDRAGRYEVDLEAVLATRAGDRDEEDGLTDGESNRA